ncbi:hypothetical protein J2X16_002074 [Pelomonas aquatica]|uniref:Uncharacterized protein n=1 Tax=Pelomonas aquatica TaxID=431058 RepID=A0ABU1Z7Y4_9BURK|nr:hypothetical protein [Pelomonas aquatica]MDR7296727.1 hypothetical protein [Pelomonas aquatica]
MQLPDLLDRRCVVGINYFDLDGSLLRQRQLAGRVLRVDAEQGITLALQHSDPAVAPAEFMLPPDLRAWFKAPPGHYRDVASGVDMQSPDYLVTWDVHRTQGNAEEGQHEWWDWVPNTERPQVGAQPAAETS